MSQSLSLLLWCVCISALQWYGPHHVHTWEAVQLAEHLEYSTKVHCIAWLGYFYIAARFLLWPRWFARGSSRLGTEKSNVWLLCIILLLTRLSWWNSAPSPSEDVWRYLWDGRRLIDGLSVYTYSPAQIIPYVDDHYLLALKERIGHPEVPTVYPPGAQILFGLTAYLNSTLGNSLTIGLVVWRALLLLADFSLLMILFRFYRRLDLNPQWLLLYAFSPLIAFESALAGHLDLWGILFMMWGLLKLIDDQKLFAGMLLGIGISIKLLPIIIYYACILFFFRQKLLFRTSHYKSIAILSTGMILSTTLVISPFIKEFTALGNEWGWPGLQTFAEHWSFNGSIYPILISIVDEYRLFSHISYNREIVKLVLVTLIVCVLWWQSIRVKTVSSDQVVNALITLSLSALLYVLFCSPVLFAWYLQWLFPIALINIGIINKNPKLFKVFNVSLAIVPIVWSVSALVTYLPRYLLLSGKEWKFGVLWSMIEYGTLVLTLALVKGYTLTRSFNERQKLLIDSD